MTIKTRRLGALLASTLGALLLVGLLATPAFAWEAEFKDVSAKCPPSGNPIVSYTLQAQEGDDGQVVVARILPDQSSKVVKQAAFNEANNWTIMGKFEVDGSLGFESVTIMAVTTWANPDEKENPETDQVDVELPKDCKPKDTTTTSSPTTTVPPSSETTTTAPPTSEETTTTAPAEETTTTVQEIGGTTQAPPSNGLPFTGANSLPMLLAALALVAGGAAAVWMTRYRARHAKQ